MVFLVVIWGAAPRGRCFSGVGRGLLVELRVVGIGRVLRFWGLYPAPLNPEPSKALRFEG